MIEIIGKDKLSVFNQIRVYLMQNSFKIVNEDTTRPWGGFFVIHESQTSKFIDYFFPSIPLSDFTSYGKLSPKILLVAPNAKLSWQYHFRRSEIWTLIGGKASIIRSNTDIPQPQQKFQLGSIVNLKQEERHRLIGLNEWGIIAEIWQHTDALNPSDEDDIVRVQDDFGR